jgi:hypothetical protein
MNQFPINFTQLATSSSNPQAGGYPYRIKGSDLMKNFVHATLDVVDELVEEVAGQGGTAMRRLKISAPAGINAMYYWDGQQLLTTGIPPGAGTFVLGCVDGTIQWIETEACDAEPEE